MKLAAARGFTLIELLVVIAIIGVLAGLTAVTLPRALEKAKITDVKNDFNQIRTAMVEYYTKYDSYPPAYGFYIPPANQQVYDKPWTQRVGLTGVEDLYDRFSDTEDTDGDRLISLVEYVPKHDLAPDGSITYDTEFYDPDRARRPPTDGQRPYVYLPVNLDDVQKVRTYFYQNGNQPLGALATPTSVWPAELTAQLGAIPPPRYDAFALISVGPAANTGTAGILQDLTFEEDLDAGEKYYLNVLHAYFLATRDWDQDQELDFDFETRSGGSAWEFPIIRTPGANSFVGAPGPLIYTYP